MVDPPDVWSRAASAFRTLAAVAVIAAGCAAPEPSGEPASQARVPQVAAEPAAAARKADQEKLGEEARARLAQAETDVQRARAKRALWLKAWEDLLAARKAMERSDYVDAIARAKGASELAQLGLEQLAYPAVK